MEKLKNLGINLKGRTSGTIKTKCPQCHETRRHKSDEPLSVNISEGLYNCHNCGWSGKVSNVEKKEYQKPEFVKSSLNDKTISWFKTRGISEQTLLEFNVTESMEYMPQEHKEMRCINFNYFREHELINIKFRDAKKNFKMVKDAELIFYNINSIIGSKECIICEGELDAMSFHEAGYKSVVSVPNGASKGNQKLEYLDNCWSYFEGMEKIIIATDGDEPGQMLKDELARRLGKDRCWIFQYPEGSKDANEILVEAGVEGLKLCFNWIKEFPLEGIITVRDCEDELDYIYEHGYPKGKTIGFHEFDRHITFRPGELTTVTGIPGSGKSEFIDQIIMNLSKLYGWKWGIFSAENQPAQIHVSKLSEKYIAKRFFSPDPMLKMSVAEKDKAKEFINNHFFFIEFKDENLTVESLITKAKQLTNRKGINGYVIDPYNYIEHKRPNGMSETEYISDFMTKLSRLAKTYELHIFLVAHPTKINKKDGVYEIPTLYNISGSAHFFNKTDNGFCVYRDFETNNVQVHIQKIRFKFIGKIGMVEFNYNKENGCYSESDLIIRQIEMYHN